jgi:hypothetical protein
VFWKNFKNNLLPTLFSPQIWSKPPSPQETEHKKKREKVLKKRKRKKEKTEKEEEKEKLQEYLQIMGKSIFQEEKNISTSKIFFWCDFLPFIIPFKENLSEIIEKVFLTHFGPSFNLAIYMTWVVSFLLTRELYIFSLQRVEWKGSFVEPRWGITYQKECLSA